MIISLDRKLKNEIRIDLSVKKCKVTVIYGYKVIIIDTHSK